MSAYDTVYRTDRDWVSAYCEFPLDFETDAVHLAHAPKGDNKFIFVRSLSCQEAVDLGIALIKAAGQVGFEVREHPPGK